LTKYSKTLKVLKNYKTQKIDFLLNIISLTIITMKYYIEVNYNDEKLLSLTEIAKIYNVDMIVVHKKIRDYERQCDVPFPKIFYKTKTEWSRVYSSDVWKNAMKN
jgi:hypothetical protein